MHAGAVQLMLWFCYAGAPRPDAFQALQAAAQHAQQAISHPQVPLPALYSQQRQQATSMWTPFLALYQMQAMMGGGLGDGMFPPTALGVAADQFMQQAQHAQQAQQALMLAAQQMASVGTSRAAPQSLGIAMGAGVGVGQVSSLLGNAHTSLPQGALSFKHFKLAGFMDNVLRQVADSMCTAFKMVGPRVCRRLCLIHQRLCAHVWHAGKRLSVPGSTFFMYLCS